MRFKKGTRKFIRPSPPPPMGSESWVNGDIVEVFDENKWKIATVSKVLGGGHFLTRLHGSTHETRVYKSNIRARMLWKDGQWVPIGKKSECRGYLEFSKKLDIQTPFADSKIRQQKDGSLPVYNDVISSQKRKKDSPFRSYLESCPGKAKKVKASDKELSQSQRRLLIKVDAFAHARYTPGNNESLNNNSDSDRCSVGSCSVPSDDPNKSSDVVSSDADVIHRLELHAYRSTLEALYASGPLSWEKEALLTNLRINLHISNDEHLYELRHLISSGSGFLD